MNMERFSRFREESDILIRSQNWLADEMDKAVNEFNALPAQCSVNMYTEEALAGKMELLELRAHWEDRESKKFNLKYSDILDA